MKIDISNTSEKPIYQQLFEQISAQILMGEIDQGYNLPPIRQAAKELRVSIITIKKSLGRARTMWFDLYDNW